ncbi:MAG: exosome non-catalytic core subunit rrp4 [Vezdaea aestivalis]|nr:MAG: exosome non-catalytic core subunit rrp4 [Vezdaea aestivalis]
MPITILRPTPYPSHDAPLSSASSDVSMTDEDPTSRPHKRARKNLVTPGETITEDAQWMRGHGTYTTPPTNIIASVTGTLQTTNKLLSIRPLRQRYTPSIGDLVVGRIVEVQTRRWKVDINAPLLAQLPLSAINLPGGILRRRTTTDELQIRAFFAEGDLLVAEVQAVHGDGSVSLHTRSMKFGKLRDGVCVRLPLSSAGGVARARRQTWAVETVSDGEIQVIAGVNGSVYVAPLKEVKETKITRLEEDGGEELYSSQNEIWSDGVIREVCRVAECVKAVARCGGRVDEDTVREFYSRAFIESETLRNGDSFLGGDIGEMIGKKVINIS